ncbi:unnamed protein product, partial [marine sediment metagenome]
MSLYYPPVPLVADYGTDPSIEAEDFEQGVISEAVSSTIGVASYYALVFNHANLTAAKAASIFDHADLTIIKTVK